MKHESIYSKFDQSGRLNEIAERYLQTLFQKKENSVQLPENTTPEICAEFFWSIIESFINEAHERIRKNKSDADWNEELNQVCSDYLEKLKKMPQFQKYLSEQGVAQESSENISRQAVRTMKKRLLQAFQISRLLALSKKTGTLLNRRVPMEKWSANSFTSSQLEECYEQLSESLAVQEMIGNAGEESSGEKMKKCIQDGLLSECGSPAEITLQKLCALDAFCQLATEGTVPPEELPLVALAAANRAFQEICEQKSMLLLLICRSAMAQIETFNGKENV